MPSIDAVGGIVSRYDYCPLVWMMLSPTLLLSPKSLIPAPPFERTTLLETELSSVEFVNRIPEPAFSKMKELIIELFEDEPIKNP